MMAEERRELDLQPSAALRLVAEEWEARESSEVSAASDPPSARCVFLAPTANARGQTIFVDPGHGGLDPGAIGKTSAGTTVSEKDVIAVALLER